MRKRERNKLADTKVREEVGEEVLQVPEHKFPCSPWRRPQWSRLFPLHREAYHGAGESGLKEVATHGELSREQAMGWNCSLWRGAHSGAGGLLWATVFVGPMLKQSVPKQLYDVV